MRCNTSGFGFIMDSKSYRFFFLALFLGNPFCAEADGHPNLPSATTIASQTSVNRVADVQMTKAPELESDGVLGVRKGLQTLWMETTINGESTWALMTIDQHPTVTTQWIKTIIGGTPTWISFIHTQTFASVLEQLPGPGSGVIGYGTATPPEATVASAATTNEGSKHFLGVNWKWMTISALICNGGWLLFTADGTAWKLLVGIVAAVAGILWLIYPHVSFWLVERVFMRDWW